MKNTYLKALSLHRQVATLAAQLQFIRLTNRELPQVVFATRNPLRVEVVARQLAGKESTIKKTSEDNDLLVAENLGLQILSMSQTDILGNLAALTEELRAKER